MKRDATRPSVRPTPGVEDRDTGLNGRLSVAGPGGSSRRIAVVLFLVIRTFLVEAFRIPTGSMEKTLLVGDFLLVNKAVYGAQVPGTKLELPAFSSPKRGDIIVFTPPHEPGKNYVKRLVGMPGDTLAMRDKVLYINGVPQVEPYVQHTDPSGQSIHVPDMYWQRNYLAPGVDPEQYRPTRDNWGPIVVPEGRYFVLGDNRDDSEDSRYWGFIDDAAIKGSRSSSTIRSIRTC